MSSVPFVLMGGLSNGASAEGVPYTVVRPALQPAYLPCDKLVSAYATSIARFVSKCGKAVQVGRGSFGSGRLADKRTVTVTLPPSFRDSGPQDKPEPHKHVCRGVTPATCVCVPASRGPIH